MSTGKSLGFKKGDFVHTGAFPAIIISDVHTFAPCCEVWGIEHEMGSAYATDLKKLTFAEFIEMARPYGYNGQAFSDVARAAIRAVNVEALPI
jgi:hypothetical protein